VRADWLLAGGERNEARRQIATAIGIFTELGAEKQRGEALQWAASVWAEGSLKIESSEG
jgi:hypothetical protein